MAPHGPPTDTPTDIQARGTGVLGEGCPRKCHRKGEKWKQPDVQTHGSG